MTYEVGSVFVDSIDGNVEGTSFLHGEPSHEDCSLCENCHCRSQNVKLVKKCKSNYRKFLHEETSCSDVSVPGNWETYNDVCLVCVCVFTTFLVVFLFAKDLIKLLTPCLMLKPSYKISHGMLYI